ncbi:glutathione peroxidase [Marinilactibacillus piezotolerans]|uniref:Glutathione peroxidase n=1 Tax=Marinilactibacillus piezotolerans TaxID=258723 RepID=A0A1I3Y1G2_9LACT|nr:glutathione peroxidase [Marinilactibacillus piezotolerans]SFK25678.1 glutathione peroxidase [Marinilactibacillus piezotolerans]
MPITDYTVTDMSENEISLSKYAGKPLLIVNTASQCGLASQLKDLENLYQDYKEKGFVVLGFPCSQFMNQEPLEGEEIAEFCQMNYGVSFPLFDKIKVNGDETHPLFKYLKDQTGNKMIKWNYTKFLIDADGEVVNRYAPTTSPKKIAKDIEKLL